MSVHRTICLNRHEGYNADTFSCSWFGCLVDKQCCKECLEKLSETKEQKIQREINLNTNLIKYHYREIERISGENLQLKTHLLLSQFKERKQDFGGAFTTESSGSTDKSCKGSGSDKKC